MFDGSKDKNMRQEGYEFAVGPQRQVPDRLTR